MFSLKLSDKILNDLGILKILSPSLLMTCKEPVIADYDRKPYVFMLTPLYCNNVHVIDHLWVLRKKNEPARIEGHHDVAMIAAYVKRARDRPRRYVEDHGQARTGLNRELLKRIEKAVRTCCIKDPSSSRGSAITDTCRTMLSVAGHHHHIMFTFCLHCIKCFSHLCRRSYGVVTHNVEIYMLGRQCSHLITVL